ncbi:NAC domain-containing protein 41-like [Argentina anserina]|uniref:NAC domain-containing protein 41-like n=1 Tax=Argentina anserina TaxID=57926 RepID=UPI0021769008|nr:NAC domain-containing protein 41-like [Potentilla anserina]
MNLGAIHYPKGMRFHPTDLELVDYFLHDKADVEKSGWYSNFIYECSDFYGEKEPWVIWDMYGGASIEEGEPLHFYTKRIKQNSNGKRFARKVGSGTWSGEYSKEVLAGDTKIGTMRNFRYEKGCDPNQNGAWLMHEYESECDKYGENEYVICVLRRNPRKAPPLLQDDQRDVQLTKKESSTKTRKRMSSTAVVEQRKRRLKKNSKLKEEQSSEVDDVDQCPELLDMGKEERKQETCNVQGCSSCTQLPGLQPYDHDQATYTSFQGYYSSINNTDNDYSYHFPEYNFYDDGASTIDEIIGPVKDDCLRDKQFQDQLYHGDENRLDFGDYLHGGVSQPPNDDDQPTIDYPWNM